MRRFLLLLFLLSLPFAARAERLGVGAVVPDTSIGEFDPEEWKGKPYVLNFFATWCVPCRAEQPALATLARAGVPIIGIAYKNKAYKVEKFLGGINPYQSLSYDPRGVGGSFWQITGVPETFMVDRHGRIQGHIAAGLTLTQVERELLPLWRKLNYGS